MVFGIKLPVGFAHPLAARPVGAQSRIAAAWPPGGYAQDGVDQGGLPTPGPPGEIHSTIWERACSNRCLLAWQRLQAQACFPPRGSNGGRSMGFPGAEHEVQGLEGFGRIAETLRSRCRCASKMAGSPARVSGHHRALGEFTDSRGSI